jgi:hypothetical protein
MAKVLSTVTALPASAGLGLLLAGLLTVCVRDASAGLMEPLDLSGTSLVATGGEVIAFFAGSSAGFDGTLRFASHYCCTEIFHNHATAVGTSISLGTYAAGMTLVFREHVITTGDNWLTGQAGRNVDKVVHSGTGRWAADASIPVNGTYVGFEDLFGGGDLDYNDLKFVLTSVRPHAVYVSEAPTALLLLVGLLVCVGLVGLAAAGRVGSSVRA